MQLVQPHLIEVVTILVEGLDGKRKLQTANLDNETMSTILP